MRIEDSGPAARTRIDMPFAESAQVQKLLAVLAFTDKPHAKDTLGKNRQ